MARRGGSPARNRLPDAGVPHPYVTEDYGLDAAGTFGLNRYYNLTGLYIYDGVVQGVYSRVSLTPIISSQYSEKTLATTIVEG